MTDRARVALKQICVFFFLGGGGGVLNACFIVIYKKLTP